ncbi:hypothetical protein A2U01_0065574, partial [Trifolium medium]|nr:hypothetical protein [Trifolium medium]
MSKISLMDKSNLIQGLGFTLALVALFDPRARIGHEHINIGRPSFIVDLETSQIHSFFLSKTVTPSSSLQTFTKSPFHHQIISSKLVESIGLARRISL